MPSSLGNETKTIIVAGPEAHKLMQEFVAGGTIKKGQLVKLDPDTGEVLAHAAGNAENLCIGVSIHSAVATERVTVVVRGYIITLAEATGATQKAGPVKSGTYDATNELARYTAAPAVAYFVAATSGGAVTTSLSVPDPAMVGWQLMPSTDVDEEIRVLLKD